MQEGLGWLWLVSLTVSLAAWLYVEISKAQSRKVETRRPLTGCELARQILDRHHFHRTSIHPVSRRTKGEGSLQGNQLFLRESVYQGSRLTDLAEALYESMGYLEASQSLLPKGLERTGRLAFGGMVLLAWGLILGGVLGGRFSALTVGGQFLFILAFFFALFSLGREWEVVQRAISEMGGIELGTDERVRMKGLLKAMRWSPLAELFKPRWPVKT